MVNYNDKNKSDQKNMIPCVVLGMTANGLSVVRSLGRKGIPVIGVDSSDREDGMYSHYLGRKCVFPDVNKDESEFLSSLLELGKELNVRTVLFPTADEYVSLISRHRKDLEKYYHFIISSPDVVDMFLDKERSAKFSVAHNIPHPYTHNVINEDHLNILADKLKYPCIIKPKDSHIWRQIFKEQKVIIVNNGKELKREYAKIKKYDLKIILQQIIVGPDSNMMQYYAFRNNNQKIQAEFCGRKLRQYPPHFGVGCLSESKYNTKIVELGRKVLKDADYRGITSLTFKIDERTNTPYFLEANIRFPLTGQLSITSGIDYPFIVYRYLAYGDNVIGSDCVQEDGVKLLNIKLDLGTLSRLRKNKEISIINWLKALKAKKYAHTYFAFDDLKPWIIVYWCFLLTICSRQFKKLFGSV